MDVVLVLNRDSGAGRPAEAVEAALQAHGASVRVLSVGDMGPSDRPRVEDVDTRSADRIVVAGGDGSVGVAAALAAARGLPLAVVPAGTANDFARAAGLPLDLEEACALAADPAARLRGFDLLRVGERPFVNAASAGLSPRAAREARPLKGALGRLAYVVGGARAAVNARPLRCAVRCDGREVFSGGAWQVTVAGTGAFGGGAATGGTEQGDGLLDVAVVEAGPRRSLARRALGMRAGRLVEQDGVRHARGRVVDLDVPDATPFNVDGEVCRPAAARFTVSPLAFRAVVGR